MSKRLVTAAVVLGLLSGVAMSALGSWCLVYSDSDCLNWQGDYWYYRLEMHSGDSYKFVLSGIPFYADFDMKFWFNSNRDSTLSSSELEWTQNSGGNGDDEVHTYTATFSGSYILKVYSYSGTGCYSLRVYRLGNC